ncbi:hypothetical protein PM022_07455 [Halorubrum ezzemoulense]|uniref:hypothetical protein n=1 Tax=Halorubrum ezzemoulense TaxID=337243 RepID=UPI00232D17F6|nr:hypothetical protein [Halorubrum ezzemoulense]MDB2274383.1 hypothetical protein [Halorubrum ezzemoulense]
MKMNRRSVLGAIGVVGVGTGAAFGSGAFSSTTAQRAVEVNVFGAGVSDSGVDGLVSGLTETEEKDLADDITANFVDVLVDASSDTVDIYDADGQSDVSTDGNNLFPENPNSETYTGIGSNYVSLVANDVTIVFGDGNGLPPNSTVSYDELFAFVENDTTSYDVTFGDTNGGSILSSVDGSDVSSGSTVEVSSSSSSPVNAEVETGTSGNSREALDIRIEETPSQ